MNLPWGYFWPIFAAGMMAGTIAGVIGFHPRRSTIVPLGAGLLAALLVAALWHGPLGAGDRLAAQIERDAQATLDYYEMRQVTAHVQRAPLTRRLVLSGPADDFQRAELVRTMDTVPGVAGTRWSPAGRGVPLIVEAGGAALLGFLFGLLLAYLIELRRRYNLQWNW